jgi:hypothetical protein
MPRMSYVERANRFDDEVAAAAASEDSDGELVALLGNPALDERERIMVTAALGEARTGREGSAAVRGQFSDALARLDVAPKDARHWWRNLACAAVVALARREGPAATDIYVAAAASAVRDVRDYGLMVLAAEGDDSAWDQVLGWVGEILSRKRINFGPWHDLLHAVEYLARHAACGSAKAEQLIVLLRANWAILARPPQKRVVHSPHVEPTTETARPLEELWPGIEPDGPPVAALDLPQLHKPVAWWRPDCRLPA